MLEKMVRIGLPVGFALICLYQLYRVSGAGGGADILAGVICLEIIAVALWHYERLYLPVIVVAFLLAGTGLPGSGQALSGRWLVLIVGAVAGFTIYMRRSHSFGTLHLCALFCIVAASVSSMVSTYPRIALLKTGSLGLIFFYGAAGVRTAAQGREAKFASGLLLGCEIVTFITAGFYFIDHGALFGNPNSLGAVAGVGLLPVLVWGLIASEGTRAYPRRLFAVILCVLLLFSSYSRAGIAAGLAASCLLCLMYRRYRLIAKGAIVGFLAALLIAATVPLAENSSAHTLSDLFIYKGGSESILGSREAPWQQTVTVIHLYPWFGSGFGTSTTDSHGRQWDYAFESTYGTIREHGSSYLAILEWVGLLGVVPFACLVILLSINVYRGTVQVRRTGDLMSGLAPLTAVVLAGLMHAAFEDWLFAPGYYICVYFWALAFVQVDLLGVAAEPARVPASSHYPSPSFDAGYGVALPGR